jgi:hypothetical protein
VLETALGELTPSLSGDRYGALLCAKLHEKAIAQAMARRKDLARAMIGEERERTSAFYEELLVRGGGSGT